MEKESNSLIGSTN